jgi:poly-gamma-glutamate synthesis protein (capsule biosynthesis protein)
MNYSLRIILFAAVITGLLLGHTKKTYDQNDFSKKNDESRLTLLFMGDIMQHQTQIDCAWDDSLNTYVYDYNFEYVAPIISSADIAIANLEVTLGGKPYTGYPAFSAPEQIVPAILKAGIDIVGTANNHSCDRGKAGILRTLKLLDSLGLKHTGTFADTASRNTSYPAIINKNGIKLALLNYTYGTNGIVVPGPVFVNMIDTIQMAIDLKKAKDSIPDKTIVFIHWGDEYKSHPNAYQTGLAEFLFRNGADLVIGMHPHVIERMERKYYPDSSGREVVVCYSLGNYISNQRDRYKDGGAMLQIELTKKDGKTEITQSGYYLTWVYTPLINGKKKFFIMPVSKAEQLGLLKDDASVEKMNIFASDSRSLLNTGNKGIGEYSYDIKTDSWNVK